MIKEPELLSGRDLAQERLLVDEGEKPQIYTLVNSDNSDPILFNIPWGF